MDTSSIKQMNEVLAKRNSRIIPQSNQPQGQVSKPAVKPIKLPKTPKKIFGAIVKACIQHKVFTASNRDIHRKLGMSFGYASQSVTKLRKLGLINVKGRTNDRKITLTGKGKHLSSSLDFSQMPDLMFKGISSKHTDTVVDIWNKMPDSQQKIFNVIASDTSGKNGDHNITKLSNGDLSRQAHVSTQCASSAVGKLRKANFIKTSGFTENRIIFLAPEGYKLVHLRKQKRQKYQKMAKSMPSAQSKIFSFIYNNMEKRDHNLVCTFGDNQISQKLHIPYSNTIATVVDLQKQHLIQNKEIDNNRALVLTPKGRHLAKHVDSQHNYARDEKNSITIGTNKIKADDLVPLNVHSPIYPYELIFKRSDKDMQENPFANGNDEITLKGFKFPELLKGFNAVKFCQDKQHPNIIGLQACQPDRKNPSVVKLLKHNTRVVIWNYMLVHTFNQNAMDGSSQHLYIPGKKLGDIVLFDTDEVKPYFK